MHRLSLNRTHFQRVQHQYGLHAAVSRFSLFLSSLGWFAWQSPALIIVLLWNPRHAVTIAKAIVKQSGRRDGAANVEDILDYVTKVTGSNVIPPWAMLSICSCLPCRRNGRTSDERTDRSTPRPALTFGTLAPRPPLSASARRLTSVNPTGEQSKLICEARPTALLSSRCERRALIERKRSN